MVCVMTARKADVRLNLRVTTFVGRESGAAELQVSPSTWDEMEARGQLPKPYLVGPNHDLKRWRWCEVEAKIVGVDRVEHCESHEPYFRGLARGAP
jgi:hypothetical protein